MDEIAAQGNTAQKPVKAHFVSKSYLRKFCDPHLDGKKVWKSSYINRNWYPHAPKKIACASGYYAKSPFDQDIENVLQLIESPIGELYASRLDKLDAPRRNERELFAAFVSMSWARSPVVRNRISLLLRNIQKEKIKLFLKDRDLLVRQYKELEAINGRPFKESVEELETEMRSKQDENLMATADYITELTVANSKIIEKVARAIESMGWKFFVAPLHHCFITSDSPAYWLSFTAPRLGYAQTLGQRDVEVVFPLSRKFCFVGGRNWSSGTYVASSAQVNEINNRTLRNTRLEIYSPRPFNWDIRGFEPKPILSTTYNYPQRRLTMPTCSNCGRPMTAIPSMGGPTEYICSDGRCSAPRRNCPQCDQPLRCTQQRGIGDLVYACSHCREQFYTISCGPNEKQVD